MRTAEVTIETEEKTELHSDEGRSVFPWCPGCRREVEMMTPEQAARIAGVTPRTIYRWIEVGAIHFVEDFGRTWVCISALPGRQQRMHG